VCKTLSGYFNRPFVPVNEEEMKDKNLTATFDNKGMDEILKILEITLDISCKTDRDTITFSSR
jgi:hypothetical protein